MEPLYQCILCCGEVLLAARGSDIDIFDIQDGTRISTHSVSSSSSEALCESIGEDSAPTLTPQKSEASSLDIVLDSEPPNKKRKISANPGSEIGSAKNGRDDAHRGSNVAPSARKTDPRIISLLATEASTHLVVVTGEDKTVTVFHIQPKGQLLKHSQRTFPKRLCAIVLTPDETDILCADKFGDVYSIPLLPLAEDLVSADQSLASEGTASLKVIDRAFVPAASVLTVHSVRNRKALEYQKRPNQKLPEKTELSFRHQLLLGHVSMLTDVAVLKNGGRWYIATADRDEHIRVSRGVPYAHIIEGFCLGHQEFVSKLCISTVYPQYLVSGGGEDELYVWDWLAFRLVQRINIKRHVDDAMMHNQSEEVGKGNSRPASGKVAVIKILSLDRATDNNQQFMAVICEAVPAVFLFTMKEDGSMKHHATLTASGNVLDLAQIPRSEHLILSLDCRRQPGSKQTVRESQDVYFSSLQKSAFTQSVEDDRSRFFDTPNCDTLADDGTDPAEFLYHVENMRKRSGEDTIGT